MKSSIHKSYAKKISGLVKGNRKTEQSQIKTYK
jgi:uncharacterized protein YajQ (UPF0234 family)